MRRTYVAPSSETAKKKGTRGVGKHRKTQSSTVKINGVSKSKQRFTITRYVTILCSRSEMIIKLEIVMNRNCCDRRDYWKYVFNVHPHYGCLSSYFPAQRPHSRTVYYCCIVSKNKRSHNTCVYYIHNT